MADDGSPRGSKELQARQAQEHLQNALEGSKMLGERGRSTAVNVGNALRSRINPQEILEEGWRQALKTDVVDADMQSGNKGVTQR